MPCVLQVGGDAGRSTRTWRIARVGLSRARSMRHAATPP